jgi:hypothetical protein
VLTSYSKIYVGIINGMESDVYVMLALPTLT